jgi:hypothetical protein
MTPGIQRTVAGAFIQPFDPRRNFVPELLVGFRQLDTYNKPQ